MTAKKTAEPTTKMVVYRGHTQSVFVPRPGGPDIEFPHGEPVEVPEDLADLLCIEESVFFAEESRGGAK